MYISLGVSFPFPSFHTYPAIRKRLQHKEGCDENNKIISIPRTKEQEILIEGSGKATRWQLELGRDRCLSTLGSWC